MSAGSVFVNYRRTGPDGLAHGHALFVELLCHDLADHFGAAAVVTGHGDHGTAAATGPARTCVVQLVVIHPEWTDGLRAPVGDQGTDGGAVPPRPGGHGIDPVHDAVSIGLLRRDAVQAGAAATVIPVLLEETEPPTSTDLPDDLQELTHLQAFRLRSRSLAADLARLRAELERHVVPRWPAQPALPRRPRKARGLLDAATPGKPFSRTILAATALFFGAVVPPRPPLPDAQGGLVVLASVSLAVLVCAGLLVVFRRPLHRFEDHVNCAPASWLLGLRLAVLTMASLVFVPLTARPDGVAALILYVALGMALLIYLTYRTAPPLHDERLWPPRVPAEPRAARRALYRATRHYRAAQGTPPTRKQREDARRILRELRDALQALHEQERATRTRWRWVRTASPLLGLLSVGWLLALGVSAAACLPAAAPAGRPEPVLGGLVLAGCVAATLATVELVYRYDRSAWHAFLDTMDDDYRVLRSALPTDRGGAP